MILIKLASLCGVLCAALVIDEKTGISIGTFGAILGAIWWFGRKFQFFIDKFTALDDFVNESRRWRVIVSDEQALAKEEREQILRHQEQARVRQEIILKDMSVIKEARELYADLIRRMDDMKQKTGHTGHTELLKKVDIKTHT